jgi:pentatricopeptide repeat protein
MNQTHRARFVMEIMAAAERGRYDTCLEIAAKMKSEGIPPDYSTYSALMQVVARGTEWLDAWAIFDDMLLTGIEPTVAIFNYLLDVSERPPSFFYYSPLTFGRLNGNVLHNIYGQSSRR